LIWNGKGDLLLKNETLETIGSVTVMLTAFAGVMGLLVFAPVLTFGFAYLGGMILNYFVGSAVVSGLNLIFDTTRFTRELIPLTCAILATIGKYFKSSQTNSSKSKK